MKKYAKLSALLLSISLLLCSCSIDFTAFVPSSISLDEIPEYSYTAYVEINGNTPEFGESELKTKSYESYGKLDYLGRCTTCKACIGTDLMPTEKRGAIGNIKPTGWHSDKYNNIDGHYLYNRCHLIGYQLTAENANERNLITGTRFLNYEGMLPFENEIANYVKTTGNHVLYQVTPVFENSELVARGVHMQALSIEDNGKGVCFNVYCYNSQPGIEIDYQTGASKAIDKSYEFDDGSQITTYILNTSSKKFHMPNCESVKKMSEKNKKKYRGTRQSLIDSGYEPCGYCNP